MKLAIKVTNEFESKAVQQALFDLGYVWIGSNKAEYISISEWHYPFYLFSCEDVRLLSWGFGDAKARKDYAYYNFSSFFSIYLPGLKGDEEKQPKVFDVIKCLERSHKKRLMAVTCRNDKGYEFNETEEEQKPKEEIAIEITKEKNLKIAQELLFGRGYVWVGDSQPLLAKENFTYPLFLFVDEENKKLSWYDKNNCNFKQYSFASFLYDYICKRDEDSKPKKHTKEKICANCKWSNGCYDILGDDYNEDDDDNDGEEIYCKCRYNPRAVLKEQNSTCSKFEEKE